MPKRYATARFKCGHEGCNEYALYYADDRQHYLELQNRYGGGKWKCTRHPKPDELLSIYSTVRVKEQTVRKTRRGQFWDHSGFIFGPGFRAFARDFPVGTKIRVTAEIILPRT
jgi:hypothetical protein